MKSNIALPILLSLSLLGLNLLNVPKVMAANPNFAVTSPLTPQEGETLFRLYFNRDDLFGKPSNRRKVQLICWTPDTAEIAQVQEVLAAYVRSNNEGFDQASIHLGITYGDIVLTSDLRQFAGVEQDGKKLILIKGSAASSSQYNSVFSLGSLFSGDTFHNRSGFSDGGSSFHAAYGIDAHRIIYLNYDHLVEHKQPQFMLQNLSLNFG